MQRMSNKMKNMRAALLFCLVAMISLSVSAQNVTVTGTVTDKTGETGIPATVLLPILMVISPLVFPPIPHWYSLMWV